MLLLSPEMLRIAFLSPTPTMNFLFNKEPFLENIIPESQDFHKKCRAILIREHMQPRNATLSFQNGRSRSRILELQ
jgi:hypothetical protein